MSERHRRLLTFMVFATALANALVYWPASESTTFEWVRQGAFVALFSAALGSLFGHWFAGMAIGMWAFVCLFAFLIIRFFAYGPSM